MPSWLLALFQRLLDLSGKATIAEVWPTLEVVVHGGVKFDPYREAFAEVLGSPTIRLQETYPCSEGFIAFGDPATGLLRLVFDHGLFYEFVPVDELESDPADAALAGQRAGRASTTRSSSRPAPGCGRTSSATRSGSSRCRRRCSTFTGRTKYTLSAFGEHLISEEVEAAVAPRPRQHRSVGPRLARRPGLPRRARPSPLRRRVPQAAPTTSARFRRRSTPTSSRRNADYQAHRAEGVGLPLPALIVARPGGFDAWMRSTRQARRPAQGPPDGQHGHPDRRARGLPPRAGRLECELPPEALPG